MSKPGSGATSIDGTSTRSGDFVIVVLTKVEDGDASALALDDLNRIESELTADYGRVTFEAFVNTLRSSADITINDDTLGDSRNY